MTYQSLRQKYPRLIYESYAINDDSLKFNYSISEHHFTHTITFKNLKPISQNLDSLVFNLGIAEMFSYWKLTCSPVIEIQAGYLTPEQTKFWHKLAILGMGQYFYENKIDFTKPDFLKITSSTNKLPNLTEKLENWKTNSVLVPLGGGKDSIVTAELLKTHFKIQPLIVYPTTPASVRISQILGDSSPIIVTRILDQKMLTLKNQGYLNGHIPYSAILAFIFLLAAVAQKIPHIAVSNEASSDESNVKYLDHSINHQYSKTLEFETDFNKYIQNTGISYFSFLRPLYELQIAKLFSTLPQYFSVFRSCNRNQQLDSWCGHCPKCLSIAMTLMPWIGEKKIIEIMGANPLIDPANTKLITTMTVPDKIKPFECVTTTKEAQICLEFIASGQTPRVKKFLSHWEPSSNTPPKFLDILKNAYRP